MGQVSSKVAYITGGASGIGAACARVLAREGASVVITDIDDSLGQALAAEITAAGGRAMYIHQDVTDEAYWPGAILAAVQAYGRLDIMVANAGIAVFGPALEMTLADFRRQNAINVEGVWLSIQHAVPAMRRTGGGSIIVMSSVAGLRGSSMLAGYSSGKGAVRFMAKSFALELAALDTNIRVNSVHPGIITTPLWGKATTPAGGSRNAALDPEILGRSVPIGVATPPEEVANAVLFLASDTSRHMTGAELVIDGGMTAGGPRRPT